MLVEVYTDGSSHARGGKPGGWAYVVVVDGKPVKLGYGGHPSTTNNLMELQGAIEGLRYVTERKLDDEALVVLVSDSRYTLGMASGEYSPSKNHEKVAELRNLMVRAKGKVRLVAGHSGDPYNERCDRFAKRGKAEATDGASPTRQEEARGSSGGCARETA